MNSTARYASLKILWAFLFHAIQYARKRKTVPGSLSHRATPTFHMVANSLPNVSHRKDLSVKQREENQECSH
jgi:hypothetical protein